MANLILKGLEKEVHKLENDLSQTIDLYGDLDMFLTDLEFINNEEDDLLIYSFLKTKKKLIKLIIFNRKKEMELMDELFAHRK